MMQLRESQYSLLLSPLKAVDFNTLFVQSVLAGHAEGKVFVDALHAPESFYVVHSYGMSLLFGNPYSAVFQTELKNYFLQTHSRRAQDEWVQVFPSAWNQSLNTLLLAGKADLYHRLNFIFDSAEFERNNTQQFSDQFEIRRTSPSLFSNMEGSVIPRSFWRDKQQFLKFCTSFTVMVQGRPASTAFTAYLQEEKLEIGIETVEAYRGRGMAQAACAALIRFCLQAGLEPVWSCRLENKGSVSLAKKLGFRETKRLPYYHIPV